MFKTKPKPTLTPSIYIETRFSVRNNDKRLYQLNNEQSVRVKLCESNHFPTNHTKKYFGGGEETR